MRNNQMKSPKLSKTSPQQQLRSPKRDTPYRALHRERATLNRRLHEQFLSDTRKSRRVSIENLAVTSDIQLYVDAQKHATIVDKYASQSVCYFSFLCHSFFLSNHRMRTTMLVHKLNTYKWAQKSFVFGIRLHIRRN